MNASINRDINQKVKFITGLANHTQIVQNDLKIICKIVENLDKKFSLWNENDNPFLLSAKEYLKKLEPNNLNDQDDQNKDISEKEVEEGEQESKIETQIVSNTAQDDHRNNHEKVDHTKTSTNINGSNDGSMSSEKEEEHPNNDEKIIKKNVEQQQNPDISHDDLIIFNNEYDENLNLGMDEVVEEEFKNSQNQLVSTISPTENKSKINFPKSKIFRDGFESDEKGAKLLDNLILYLRIVHSIDYYSATEYLQEHLMPYKCGILHIRGHHSSSQQNNQGILITAVIYGDSINRPFNPLTCKKEHVVEWLRLFDNHIKQITDAKEPLDLEFAKRLGLKDQEEELKKFFQENSKKLSSSSKHDRDDQDEAWVCKLSDRRFKSEDHLRKHLETKYAHMIEDIRLECEFFNRFLLDPKRPYLPEHPMSRGAGMMNNMHNSINNGNNMIMNQNMMSNNPPMPYAPTNYHNYGQYPAPGQPLSYYDYDDMMMMNKNKNPYYHQSSAAPGPLPYGHTPYIDTPMDFYGRNDQQTRYQQAPYRNLSYSQDNYSGGLSKSSKR